MVCDVSVIQQRLLITDTRDLGISLIRELLKSTHHTHTRADSVTAPLSENFKLASFSPSLLSAMRFSHSGASAHTQGFADAWHDIDLEILGIVDDHLRNLDHVASMRSNSLDQSLADPSGISHGRDNSRSSSQHRDAWAEGELVCQFLERAKRWILTTGWVRLTNPSVQSRRSTSDSCL